jgi:hypothetical protein
MKKTIMLIIGCAAALTSSAQDNSTNSPANPATVPVTVELSTNTVATANDLLTNGISADQITQAGIASLLAKARNSLAMLLYRATIAQMEAADPSLAAFAGTNATKQFCLQVELQKVRGMTTVAQIQSFAAALTSAGVTFGQPRSP